MLYMTNDGWRISVQSHTDKKSKKRYTYYRGYRRGAKKSFGTTMPPVGGGGESEELIRHMQTEINELRAENHQMRKEMTDVLEKVEMVYLRMFVEALDTYRADIITKLQDDPKYIEFKNAIGGTGANKAYVIKRLGLTESRYRELSHAVLIIEGMIKLNNDDDRFYF